MFDAGTPRDNGRTLSNFLPGAGQVDQRVQHGLKLNGISCQASQRHMTCLLKGTFAYATTAIEPNHAGDMATSGSADYEQTLAAYGVRCGDDIGPRLYGVALRRGLHW